eukprot:scaffold331_cov117-Cylindrotheca_fusiformis.AAC.8
MPSHNLKLIRAYNSNLQLYKVEAMSNIEVNRADPNKSKKTKEEQEVNLSYERFGMREVVIPLGGSELRFNPLTSIFAIILLWGLSIWCMVEPVDSRVTLLEYRRQISDLFTWFYVGTNPAFMFFIIWVAYRFGDVRLGKKDAKPEFDDVTYFAMLFSAGIGVGLFFYGVAEPLWHRESNWFAESGYHSQDEIDAFAMNLTVFHWGITGWSQYLVVAICAGLASFRFDLPLTLRSCFYPLLGDYTWGWLGDVIDGYTIVTTVAGVCTSLGLGAFQIAAGLKRVNAIDTDISSDDETNVNDLASVSNTCLKLDLVWVRFGENRRPLYEYLQTLLTYNETGYYFQYSIFQLNFHTDAFGQLNEGEGRATDGHSAATWFMDAWTIFYIGWWVAWAAFVGLFIARISKGRTIRSIIVFSYVCPLIYTIIWFGVFGGVGFRQARQAKELQELGTSLHNNSEYYQSSVSEFCYDVPQVAEIPYVSPDNVTKTFTNTLMGVTPVCRFNSADDQTAWFNVLNSFTYPNDFEHGFGAFLTWVSIFSVSIYFITSSDSGSLIVDHLASNGFEESHWLQRVFWAFTEGACATALLVSGGEDALKGLQAASILSGLPFTFFLIFMCQTIVSMCNLAEENDAADTNLTMEEDYKRGRKFQTPIFGGIFNIFENLLSFGCVPKKRAHIASVCAFDVTGFFMAIFCPFIPLYRILSKIKSKPEQVSNNKISTLAYVIFYYLFIGLFASISKSGGFRAFGWSALAICGIILCVVRGTVRGQRNIEGNIVADFIVATLFWPQVLVQLEKEVNGGPSLVSDGEQGEEQRTFENMDKSTA